MQIELKEHFLRQVQNILKEHVPECEVWVFGSRAGGSAKPFSDLDLALISPSGVSIRQLALLDAAFEDSDLPFRVDIVDWKSLNPSFRERIARNRAVIFPPAGKSHQSP